ncbi:MAG: bifunctional ornithine acetyltransferase/N-acetylglutamate synthase [Spirochaetia bacterium]|jgi:glutamate N-acetyltransferase/amino-acid N-acetyltransferase|nr:bifunctional ornithine acetyltransferase/N-acetylglutamate synthase [Spirochaetia bacterium]
MEKYNTKEEYISELEKRGKLPEGFRTAVLPLSFFPAERPVEKPLPMKMSLLMLDKPTSVFGAVFTRNKCPGAPVILGKERLSSGMIRGVLVNNKIANVCIESGLRDSLALLEKLASETGTSPDEYFPSSTGIIGWRLPVKEMEENIPALIESLEGGSALNLAKGIMTTDSFPKLRSAEVGEGRIVAVAKGAGMIEPNMATMLSYIMTDVEIERDTLRQILKRVVEKTYNCISVDSDQSTSDTAVILSSCIKPAVSPEVFEAALLKVCSDIAQDIVRNAEGTGHVIKVNVEGASDFETARSIGKAVVNSPLVTTAIFGNDPNVGRILSSLGDYAGNNSLELDTASDAESLSISLGGEVVFEKGSFRLDQEKEVRLSEYLKSRMLDSEKKEFPAHDLTVDINIRLGNSGGSGSALVYGSDLSYSYVRENADYRS